MRGPTVSITHITKYEYTDSTAAGYMLVTCVSLRAPWVPMGFQVYQVSR